LNLKEPCLLIVIKQLAYLKTHHNNKKAKFAKAVETLTYSEHKCITKLKHVKNPQEIIEIISTHGELCRISFCVTKVADCKGLNAKAQFI
jgi:CTP-dependent riboflavin kinase